MIARFRSLRLLGLLLVAGTPGLGGVALEALHPCPTEMPWVTDSSGEHAHHSGGDSDSDPAQSADCNCIGSCSVSARAGTPGCAPSVTWITSLDAAPRQDGRAVAPALLPIDRFPPKTAPPLLG